MAVPALWSAAADDPLRAGLESYSTRWSRLGSTSGGSCLKCATRSPGWRNVVLGVADAAAPDLQLMSWACTAITENCGGADRTSTLGFDAVICVLRGARVVTGWSYHEPRSEPRRLGGVPLLSSTCRFT